MNLRGEVPSWQKGPFRESLSSLPYDWIRPPVTRRREDRAYLVTICGAYASGKSSLAEVIADMFPGRCMVIDEDFPNNPYLVELDRLKGELRSRPDDQDLRTRIQACARGSEMHCLDAKRKQVERLNGLLSNSPEKVFCLAADPHVDPGYALAYYFQDLLTLRDLDSYLQEFQTLPPIMPYPDVVFGLIASMRNVIVRKIGRQNTDPARQFEAGIPDGEVAVLAHIANRTIRELKDRQWPVTMIDTNKWNYVDNSLHRGLVKEEIRRALAGTSLKAST